jgi:hypothetical protein
VAYRVNRMLGMDLVPPVAYRRNIDVDFKRFAEGALMYRIPDAHLLRKVDPAEWGLQGDVFLSDTRILDVLIQNSDRHHGNLLRGKHWVDGQYRPALIDQAAGFRAEANVKMTDRDAFGNGPVQVVRKSTLDNLRKLSFRRMKAEAGEFLSDREIRDFLKRRDGIVSYFERLIAKNGYDAVVKDVTEFRP